MVADNSQKFKFAYDSESGKYGYMVKEADTDVFVPFKSAELKSVSFTEQSKTIEFEEKPVLLCVYGSLSGGFVSVFVEKDNSSNGYGMSIKKNTDTNYTITVTNAGQTTTVLYV